MKVGVTVTPTGVSWVSKGNPRHVTAARKIVRYFHTDEFRSGHEHKTEIFEYPQDSVPIKRLESVVEAKCLQEDPVCVCHRAWPRETTRWTKDINKNTEDVIWDVKTEFSYYDSGENPLLGLLHEVRHLGESNDDRYLRYTYDVTNTSTKYLVVKATEQNRTTLRSSGRRRSTSMMISAPVDS